MKKTNNESLQFEKKSISELNDVILKNVNGGTNIQQMTPQIAYVSAVTALSAQVSTQSK